MTPILHNGDYIPDGRGGFCRQSGSQGLLQEVLFRLSCRRGSFPLMPELGSRLYTLYREKPSARDMMARQYVQEALKELDVTLESAAVAVQDDGIAVVTVMLRASDETLTLEVTV